MNKAISKIFDVVAFVAIMGLLALFCGVVGGALHHLLLFFWG
jgi:hypothetical protein